jgi:hypothetical protein
MPTQEKSFLSFPDIKKKNFDHALPCLGHLRKKRKMMHTSEHQAWHVPVGARVFELLPIQGLCDLVIAYAREFMGVSVQTVPNAT